MTVELSYSAESLQEHMAHLALCRRCPLMESAPVVPEFSPDWRAGGVLLVGQAPGIREPGNRRLFAWTAGTTLFKWIEGATGVSETQFRARVYMAATCRCFPGKARGGGGDRAPSRQEMANCAPWLERELELLRPGLILAIGKLAISRFAPVDKLDAVIGRVLPCEITLPGSTEVLRLDVLPLPHPSGASTWHRREPGLTLLPQALAVLNQHPVWRASFRG